MKNRIVYIYCFSFLLVSINTFSQKNDFLELNSTTINNNSILTQWKNIRDFNYKIINDTVRISPWLLNDLVNLRKKVSDTNVFNPTFIDLLDVYYFWFIQKNDQSIHLLKDIEILYNSYDDLVLDDLVRKTYLTQKYGLDKKLIDNLKVLTMKKIVLTKESNISANALIEKMESTGSKILHNEFIYPPPKPSDQVSINNNCFVGLTLYEVKEVIENALYQSNVTGQKYYPIENGFAILTKMVEIDINCSPTKEDFQNPVLLGFQFNIISYFKSIFLPIEGKLRFSLIIVDNSPFKNRNYITQTEELKSMYGGGNNNLDKRKFEKIKYDDYYTTTLLLYEFSQNEYGETILNIPSNCSILNYIQTLKNAINILCKNKKIENEPKKIESEQMVLLNKNEYLHKGINTSKSDIEIEEIEEIEEERRERDGGWKGGGATSNKTQ